MLALVLGACCPAPGTPARCPEAPDATATGGHETDLQRLAPPPELLASPELLTKLRKSPHNFFRGINTGFATEVCRRFAPVMTTLPVVTLHGDAHLEQLAVTEDAAGLWDFDDSASGPAVIDVVRFGTSVALAARQRGWSAERAVQVFLAAYDRSLDRDNTPSVPAALTRLREGSNGQGFVARADAMIVRPIPKDKELEFAGTWARYVALMLQIQPDKGAGYFQIKRRGHLGNSGLGSMLTKRILVHIEGPSPADGDDHVLEMKEVRDMTAIPCVEGRGGMSLRLIASGPRFGAKPDPFLALVPRGPDEPLDDAPWWIQSWWPRYVEVEIDKLVSEQDLHEVAAFGAARLAHGHTAFLPPPYDVHLRTIVHAMMREHEALVRRSILELAEATWQAHAAL